MDNRKKVCACASIAVFFWAISYLLTKLALRGFSALSIASMRLLIASVCLALALKARKLPLPDAKTLLACLPTALFGFVFFQLTFNKANLMISSATISVIIATAPILTAILARIFLKEKLSRVKYIAIVIAFLGVVTMFILSLNFTGIGLIWPICSAATLAVYYTYQRAVLKNINALVVTAYSIFFAALALSYNLPKAFLEVRTAPVVSIVSLVALGIGCSAVAYFIWSKALALAENAASVANFKFIEPFIATLCGSLVLHESITAPTLIGGSTIIIGLLLFYFGEKLFKQKTG